jgi:hypothetical protein
MYSVKLRGPGRTVYSNKRFVVGLAISCLGVLTTLNSIAPIASAAEAEPSIIGLAWYWEQSQNQTVDTPNGSVQFDSPNQFCPTLPSSLGSPDPATCAEGRMPVEVVGGDYESPDKISAVAFDLSMIPIGSTVSKFEVTLLEAESGCQESDDSQTGQKCEQTDERNSEGKEVQACVVDQIFGDGENRPYKEVPKYTCSDSDPTAKRKEIENDAEADPADADPDHTWTWDLTSYAQEWAETPPQCTCILLSPVEPKEGSDDASDLDWRVVFAGPKVDGGVKAELVFKPAAGSETIPPPSTPPTTGTTTTTGSTGSSSGFGTTTTGTFGGSDTPDTGGGSSAPETPDDTQAPVEVAAEPTSAEIPQPYMPAYVWLALLGGLVCWSLVRSLVFDKIAGNRPDGVLAQIHEINASRGGAVAAEAGSSPAGAFTRGLQRVGRGFSALASKLPGMKKG